MSFDEFGITVVRYDGINYESTKYKVQLYQPTLDYIKHNACLGFDSNELLRIRFINYDKLNALEKIKIENGDLVTVDCGDMVSNIFNQMKTNMMQYLNNIDYVVDNGIKYYIEADSEFEVLEKDFDSMHEDNFVRDFTMQQFNFSIKTVASISFTNASTNSKIHFNAPLELHSKASVCLYDNNCNIEMQKYDYTIKCDSWNYEYKDTVKNQNPINIMELMNKTYYLKFDKSVSSKDNTDYGYYKNCTLYNKSINLYKIQLEDVYGVGTTNRLFKYEEICYAKIVSIDYHTFLILNYYQDKWVISKIDIDTQKRLEQHIVDSKMIFDSIYSYTDEQLISFENILTSMYKYDSIKREMNIISVSDYDSVYLAGITKKRAEMESITNVDNNVKDKSFSYQYKYEYDYPLNLKNRSKYLKDIEIGKK